MKTKWGIEGAAANIKKIPNEPKTPVKTFMILREEASIPLLK
jgi:hypothetical protein